MTRYSSARSRGAELVALSVLIAVAVGCNISIPGVTPLHKETRTSNIPHVNGAAIQVETVNGSVVVKQDEREDVEIVAHLKAVSAERLEATKVVTERDEHGALSISVEWPEGKPRTREGCRFEVLIPDATGVTLLSSNGKLELAGLEGDAELTTSNGSIVVESHSGAIKAKTSNGSISAMKSQGAIDVKTSNGRIKVLGATDRVMAKTSNGAVEVGLAAEGPGPIEVRTSNGTITLGLSSTMRGELTLSTSNGSVNVDSNLESKIVSKKKTSAVLDLGESGNSSSATTTNGSIRVKGG